MTCELFRVIYLKIFIPKEIKVFLKNNNLFLKDILEITENKNIYGQVYGYNLIFKDCIIIYSKKKGLVLIGNKYDVEKRRGGLDD